MNRGAVVFAGLSCPNDLNSYRKSAFAWAEAGLRFARPECILAVSSHWAKPVTYVRTADNNPQKYDSEALNSQLNEIKYEPPACPPIARLVLKELEGIAKENNDWGLDFGVWSILSEVFPKADVPVVMMSTDTNASPEEHFIIGKKIRSLREKGVMIYTCGNSINNSGPVNCGMSSGYEWAEKFDGSIKELILKKDYHSVVGFEHLPLNDIALPSCEVFYPLLTALGAVSSDDRVKILNDYRIYGSLSLTSFLWI